MFTERLWGVVKRQEERVRDLEEKIKSLELVLDLVWIVRVQQEGYEKRCKKCGPTRCNCHKERGFAGD